MSNFSTADGNSPEAGDLILVNKGNNGTRSGDIDDCTEDQTVVPSGVVTILAQHPDTYLSEEALARGFGVSTRTIRRWEKVGTLPPRTPGVGMWRIGNIISWFAMKTEEEEKRVKAHMEQLTALNE